MNSVQSKVSSVMPQKKNVIMTKKLGGYNRPMMKMGHYNVAPLRKLGHYNC